MQVWPRAEVGAASDLVGSQSKRGDDFLPADFGDGDEVRLRDSPSRNFRSKCATRSAGCHSGCRSADRSQIVVTVRRSDSDVVRLVINVVVSLAAHRPEVSRKHGLTCRPQSGKGPSTPRLTDRCLPGETPAPVTVWSVRHGRTRTTFPAHVAPREPGSIRFRRRRTAAARNGTARPCSARCRSWHRTSTGR